jgi:hypothetical protein
MLESLPTIEQALSIFLLCCGLVMAALGLRILIDVIGDLLR